MLNISLSRSNDKVKVAMSSLLVNEHRVKYGIKALIPTIHRYSQG
jgi:hypothetical protein